MLNSDSISNALESNRYDLSLPQSNMSRMVKRSLWGTVKKAVYTFPILVFPKVLKNTTQGAILQVFNNESKSG